MTVVSAYKIINKEMGHCAVKDFDHFRIHINKKVKESIEFYRVKVASLRARSYKLS